MLTLGNYLNLSTFGESHGAAYGGILSNFPSGISLDIELIQKELYRRKPGQSALVTQRKESDCIQIFSGVFEGKTTGAPIGFHFLNENVKSQDYSHLAHAFRPSHADFTYEKKFGIRDYRGGGRSSARETLNWVAAGAMCRQLIPQVNIHAYVSSVGEIFCEKPYQDLDFSKIDDNDVRCPDAATAEKMEERIREVRKAGDSIGGTITCVIQNVPIGWGEPVFGKLQAELAHAMLSINACKGFEYGSGFCGAKMLGSAHNDLFNSDFSTQTNLSGGIQGGISNGMDIYFRVAFKPVATLMQNQPSIDTEGKPIELKGKGRHDPCVLPRAVPVVENLAAFVLADMYLIHSAKNALRMSRSSEM